MNYLVHLFLADRADSSLVGNLLGDFLKGRLEDLPLAYREGVALHRAVDAFAETHPVFRRSKARISAGRRRFAGIVVDMSYDHFLAREWAQHSPVPLAEFATEVYDALDAEAADLPERLRVVLPRMRAEDWLSSYREVETIGLALDRIASRLRRGERFLGAGEELVRAYAGLEADFRAFLPDVLDLATTR